MSADPAFTTAGEKWLSGILPFGTEDYNADNTGGQALDFFVSPNTPGVNPVPVRAMTIDSTSFVGIGTWPSAP